MSDNKIKYKLITNNRKKDSGITLTAKVVASSSSEVKTEDKVYDIVINPKKPTDSEVLKNLAVTISNIFAKDIYSPSLPGWDILMTKLDGIKSQGFQVSYDWTSMDGITGQSIQDSIFELPKYNDESINNSLNVTISKGQSSEVKTFPFIIHHWPANTIAHEAILYIRNNANSFLSSSDNNYVFAGIENNGNGEVIDIQNNALAVQNNAITKKIDKILLDTNKINEDELDSTKPVDFTEYDLNIETKWERDTSNERLKQIDSEILSQILTPAQNTGRSYDLIKALSTSGNTLEPHMYLNNANAPVDYYYNKLNCTIVCTFAPVSGTGTNMSTSDSVRQQFNIRAEKISLVLIAALVKECMNPRWFIPRGGGSYGFDSSEYSIEDNVITVNSDNGFVLRAPCGNIKELINGNAHDNPNIQRPTGDESLYSISKFSDVTALSELTGLHGIPEDYKAVWEESAASNRYSTKVIGFSTTSAFPTYSTTISILASSGTIIECHNSQNDVDIPDSPLQTGTLIFDNGTINENFVDEISSSTGNTTYLANNWGCVPLYIKDSDIQNEVQIKYTFAFIDPASIYDSTAQGSLTGTTIEYTLRIKKAQASS